MVEPKLIVQGYRTNTETGLVKLKQREIVVVWLPFIDELGNRASLQCNQPSSDQGVRIELGGRYLQTRRLLKPCRDRRCIARDVEKRFVLGKKRMGRGKLARQRRIRSRRWNSKRDHEPE